MPLSAVAERALYYTTYWQAFWTFGLGWSFRASGRQRVPATGPVMLLANHQSHFDPPLIGLASPRPLTYLARHTLFTNRLFAAYIRGLGAVPIDRETGKDGLQAVLTRLAEGRAVLMFPEGTRTEDGLIQPLKPGVTLLVKRAEFPIVPCGIAGAFQAWPRRQALPRPSPLFLPDAGRSIAVVYGEPIPPGYYRKMEREAILTDLQARITAAYQQAEKLRRKPK
jgi:1-acyl-sn-glycerol-3-phosphate acyltransferase